MPPMRRFEVGQTSTTAPAARAQAFGVREVAADLVLALVDRLGALVRAVDLGIDAERDRVTEAVRAEPRATRLRVALEDRDGEPPRQLGRERRPEHQPLLRVRDALPALVRQHARDEEVDLVGERRHRNRVLPARRVRIARAVLLEDVAQRRPLAEGALEPGLVEAPGDLARAEPLEEVAGANRPVQVKVQLGEWQPWVAHRRGL